MTLATHIVIAGAITRPIAGAHPALLFLVSLASHYLADAIPHWDYDIRSVPDEHKQNPDAIRWNFSDRMFWKDVFRFGIDACIGFGMLLLFSWPESWPALFNIVLISAGSVLPDFLQGVYFTRKAEFLKPVKQIHGFFHTRLYLGPYPLIGIPFQALFFFLSIYFLL